MRIIGKTVVAFGFIGAIVLSAPSATRAQGIYFEGPGIGFGVGRPWYRDHYYGYYGGPYAYSRPYYDDWRWRYRHHRWRHWD